MAAFESKKYAWRSGYSYRVPASTVGGVLEKIEKEKGQVTSEALLDYSRDEEAETHPLFEWDDSVAAEKYRLGQAGKIINQLEVELVYVPLESTELEVATREAAPISVSAFMNVAPRATRCSAMFVSAEAAMSNKEMRKQVLANALQELQTFKRKYNNYKEFAEVFAAIQQVENKIE